MNQDLQNSWKNVERVDTNMAQLTIIETNTNNSVKDAHNNLNAPKNDNKKTENDVNSPKILISESWYQFTITNNDKSTETCSKCDM